ncbi:hypothetical protein ACCO45_009308 [Purpureocillium lilacinum]|uniref:Uncharacterized protein n=1 Tax=Purpureocillium lilacinum TaxID=33203 RepID=A0ACC4DKU9_PURLI
MARSHDPNPQLRTAHVEAYAGLGSSRYRKPFRLQKTPTSMSPLIPLTPADQQGHQSLTSDPQIFSSLRATTAPGTFALTLIAHRLWNFPCKYSQSAQRTIGPLAQRGNFNPTQRCQPGKRACREALHELTVMASLGQVISRHSG